MSKPVIALFRRDLRLGDSPALFAAVATGQPVVCLFVLDDAAPGMWAPGGASRWWLHHSLVGLDQSVRATGGALILRRGTTVDVAADLATESGATALYLARRHEPWAIDQEDALNRRLSSAGVSVHRFGGSLLSEPEQVRTG